MDQAVASARPGATHVEAVRERFPGVLKSAEWQCDDQVTITVALDSLPDVVEFLYFGRGGWLPMMVGNDERPINGSYALYYILSMEGEDRCWCTVRVEVPADTLEFPSVTPRVPACVWSEREVRDMFGLRPVGLPDERRLVLPDDWPDDLYPLRKDSMDYRHRPMIASEVENYEFLADTGGKETTVMPMGPLHITSDEPGHFRLFVEGEDIIDADYRLFYVHRGMEKVAEARMNYDAVTFLADRVCGICGNAHSVAYAEAVEHAQGIAVPLRAQYIRAISLEVERMHSHLLNLGLVCHFTGFDTGFMHFFRVREDSMRLAELLTGHRKTYGLNLIGGVRRDILMEQKDETLRVIRKLRDDVNALLDELMSTPNFLDRTKGVGMLDRKIARAFSPVGPCVRGSGFARDVRFDHPFDGYADIQGLFKARSHDGCDVLSRTQVRIEEFMDSIAMCEFWLENMPDGRILNEDWKYTPHKFGIGYTEAPRGEDVHWAMVGDNQKCYRWRAKAATYSNWPVLRYMFRGNTVADAALIVGSIDPCYSCTDRVTFVDVKKGTEKTVSKAQLESYCARRTYSPLKD
ncbi:hydrogenase large subunit [Eggerthellaceae bacterium zg-1084]|uniref:Hydrogenase large subunit n=1 Tax=Berryella wangjianweii TaxID=2734634 RepID=A0A6M8J631_9ACTN|nr:hydrogenase large subunit [Berryella wangjianweii]NPD30774.1 hydrogenase large subunit [Berryella wangjianweii]NPD32007.1 hydrogenase large subunit [Eggerthellaceae bacterium zg-997]QKF07406.1 hydrogenase large subunit [Berryella wangjianweii]